jgi:hypothetical protein
MNIGIEDTTVVQRIMKLHSVEIPRHLMQMYPVRTGMEFDPNVYFTVLTHLAMKPGYIIDYVYCKSHLGSHQCIYARRIDEKPASHFEHRDWEEKNSGYSFLVADGSSDGYFQLAVFRRLAGQFYLYWHANYNDIRIVTTPEEMEVIISEVNLNNFGRVFTNKQVTDMRLIDPQPTVEVSDSQASVTYCVFTKWGGLARLKDSYLRPPPHRLVDSDVLDEVKHDCDINF